MLRVDESEFQRFKVNATIVAIARRTGLIFRVANAPAAGTHHIKERILLAVDIRLEEVERLAAGLALEPELVAARGPEDEFLLRERFLHREFISVGDEDNLFRIRILHGYRNNAFHILELGKVESKFGRFFFGGHNWSVLYHI